MIRKIFLGMLIAFVLAPAVYGDTYVKINHHSDGYYNYGNMVPAENTQIEYWFGDKRMVCSTSRAKLILDFKRKKFRVVNLSNKMFVEVSLPPDFEKIVDKKVTALFRMDEAGGSVKPTGETKKISNRACTGYERKFWAADQGSRYENRIETLWMTIDVPFDVTLYHSLNAILVDLYRYVAHWDRQLVNDLKRTPGFPMAVYSRFYIKKTVSKAYREVIEITEKKPPVGLYSIPAGYKKKEKLTPHFFNSFPYHGDWGILDQ